MAFRVLFVLAALAVLYGCGQASSPAEKQGTEGQNGKIAFVKVDQDIYVMNPDGTGERNLTRTPNVEESQPIWSPSGEKLAFIRDDNTSGAYTICVMNADGSGMTEIADTWGVVSEESLAWSPDGEKIAFVTSAITGTSAIVQAGIYVMNADGSGMTEIADSSVSEPSPGGDATVDIYSPVWSPDSEKIAFTRLTSEPNRSASASATAASAPMPTPDPVYEESGIYVVNADGSGQSSLIKNEPAGRPYTYFEFPAWSPDGERIAFEGGTTQGTFGDDIYVMNADGSGRTKLTDTSGVNEASPAWSPDGEKIAFEGGTEGSIGGNPNDIYVMNADGTGRMRLSDTARAGATAPTWSPDGEKIAFWLGEETGVSYAICVMNADGTGRRCVADEVNAVGAGGAWGSG